MITSPHTLKHWPNELYLPSAVIDRQNRENWVKAGAHTLEQRATAEVEARLSAYTAPKTDPHLEAELLRFIKSGLLTDEPLPIVPKVRPKRAKTSDATPQRKRRRRRRA